MDGLDMTAVECAKRIIDQEWKAIQDVDIQTLGYALEIVEIFRKNAK